MKNSTTRVGLAEFEIRPEFGVFKLYGSGYGREATPLATIDSPVAASVLLNLLRCGSVDVRRVPRAPIDEIEVFLVGPIEQPAVGIPMPTSAE